VGSVGNVPGDEEDCCLARHVRIESKGNQQLAWVPANSRSNIEGIQPVTSSSRCGTTMKMAVWNAPDGGRDTESRFCRFRSFRMVFVVRADCAVPLLSISGPAKVGCNCAPGCVSGATLLSEPVFPISYFPCGDAQSCTDGIHTVLNIIANYCQTCFGS
jgi:hypothetical protein